MSSNCMSVPLFISSCSLESHLHHQPLSLPATNTTTVEQIKKTTMITKKELIMILVFALSTISVLRLLKISIITSFYPSPLPTAALPPPHMRAFSSPSPSCRYTPFGGSVSSKEYRFLSNLVSLRAPCNLLVFGLEQQYLNLSSINVGGLTVILEDNQDKLASMETDHYKDTRIHRVEYHTLAGDAYKLLKQARQNPADCGMQYDLLEKSSCPLALTRLPKEVYKRRWDVVVVDGPRGDTPDAPGRMAAIYTASVIARSGNLTDVVVHDVDRMIEKWFAWEFLCDENLVSSKGKLWNFRIAGNSSSSAFCPAKLNSSST